MELILLAALDILLVRRGSGAGGGTDFADAVDWLVSLRKRLGLGGGAGFRSVCFKCILPSFALPSNVAVAGRDGFSGGTSDLLDGGSFRAASSLLAVVVVA